MNINYYKASHCGAFRNTSPKEKKFFPLNKHEAVILSEM